MRNSGTLLAGLAIIGALHGGTAAAATVDKFNVKAESLDAVFFTSSACDVSATHIVFGSSVTKIDHANAIDQSFVVLEVQYVNVCTGDNFVMSGFMLDDIQSHFQGGLNSASLVADVPVADEAGTQTSTFHVNLTFQATGPIETVQDKIETKEGNVKMKESFLIDRRPGEANGSVAGILRLATGDQVVDVASAPSMSASFGSVRFGSMTITKNH